MAFRYLDKDGAVSFWTNIKNYILSKIPTKTSELTNDSGYITNTDTCLHKSGGETFTGYKKVENINSGLIFKSTNYQAEIRLSGNEPYDVSIVSHKLSNDTYSYHTLMDRYGNVFPGIYRPRASNLTVYVSNAVSNNDGDGLTANTAFSYSALRNFLGAIRMQSGSSLGGTYNLTVNLIPTGTSYGTCRFDSTKMPYVKNLVIQTSTGIEGTPENYTTNCPDLSQLYISGNMDVTVRNIKCGEIGVYQGAKVTLTNFNAVGQVRADINGYVNVGGYLYVFYFPLSTAPRASLFDASLDGHIRIENTNTTINFSEQVYYTAGVMRAINHGYMYANISRWKLLGIKPCVIAGSSTTVLTTCSTPGNVSAKTVETGTTIGTSSVIGVTFSETNTADNPTLNVNGLGDWPIVADNNAVDIKHYLPFGVRIIFKRFGNTWKITNTKDLFQYIAGDCSMYVSGTLGTTYNNGEFNFGDYIVSQSTSSTNTGIYNAVQYNINGTNIFDGIRTITKAWVFKESPQVQLRTEIGGTTYGSATVSFRDVNGKNLGASYACTYANGGSGVGLTVYNIINNTDVYKNVALGLSQNGDSHFHPGNSNDTYLGSEYYTWKGVYANKYYLGSTEFGDIVTHNASEFLTQHQSLADYATKQDLADLVNSAPSTLDTLNELASALGNDPNFATTVSTQIGTKANDNAVVHLTGNETINGTKTLTDSVKIKTSQIVAGTTYQSNKGSQLLFTDNNEVELGKIWNLYEASDSSTKIRISSSNKFSNSSLNPNGTLTSAYFDVGVKANGTRYLASNSTFSLNLIPTATYSFSLGSSSNKWKELWAAYAFTQRIDFQDNTIEKGVIPQSAVEHSIRLTDKNNAAINYITFQKRADSNEPSRICIRINNENEDSYKSVNFNGSAFYPENNNAIKLGTSSNRWSEVHTTSLYLNGTQLDPSVFALDNSVVHTSGDETIGGNKIFSNRTIFSTTSVNGELTLRQNAYDPATNGQSALSSICNFNITARSVTNGGFAQIGFYGAPGFTTTRLNCRYYTGASESEETWVEYTVTGTSGSITGRSFKPSTNGLVDLGANANRWKSVYATNYYYGSDNVEFSNKFVTTDTAQEITNTKTFKDAITARKLTSVEAGNVIPSSDKLISDIWQDKNGKELGRIYFTKTSGGNTALVMRAGDWFSESEGVYSLNASGTNRRAELQLYSDSSGNCCIKPNGLFSAHIKPLNSSVYLGDSTKPFGRVYANSFQFCNAGLLPDTDVQTTEEHSIGFFGQSNKPLSYITFQKRPNLKDRVAIRINTTSSSYKSYDFDATCFYPESNNSVDIGSTTNIFKNIYCNNYYKGTTAFGDIVTHNASEFLTSHQSLANYVTTNTSQSISGIKTFPTNIDLANTSTSQREYWALKFSKTDTNGTGASQLGVFQPSNSSDFVACLRLGNPRGDNKPTTGTGVNTGNCWSGIGVYYNYALNRGYPYAPSCNSWGDSSNADAELASTAWVRRYCETTKGFLTSHQSLVNYVTTDTDQSITGTKTFGNGTLIVDNGIGSNVHGEIKLNGSRPGYIVADNASDGVFDNAGCGVSILLQDAGKPLHIGAYKTDSNGRVFVDNTNKNPVLSITSGLIRTSTLIPENDTGNSSFRILSQIDYANGNTSKLLDVRFIQYDNTNATSAIYSNDDNKTSLGLSSKRWSSVHATNAYITNLNLNGNAFDPTSVSGNIGDIVFASAYYSSITGTAALDLTVSGNTLYLACFDNNTLVIDSSASSLPGTWKFLGRGKPTTTSGNADTKRVGLWKRIA